MPRLRHLHDPRRRGGPPAPRRSGPPRARGRQRRRSRRAPGCLRENADQACAGEPQRDRHPRDHGGPRVRAPHGTHICEPGELGGPRMPLLPCGHPGPVPRPDYDRRGPLARLLVARHSERRQPHARRERLGPLLEAQRALHGHALHAQHVPEAERAVLPRAQRAPPGPVHGLAGHTGRSDHKVRRALRDAGPARLRGGRHHAARRPAAPAATLRLTPQ